MLIVLAVLLSLLFVYSLAKAGGKKTPKPDNTVYSASHPFRK